MRSPTQLTLALLRKRGYECDIAEHFNTWSKTRKDLFNWIDIVAAGENEIIGVQCTSRTNASSHRKKILENCEKWKNAGGKVLLVTWAKVKNRWKPYEENL